MPTKKRKASPSKKKVVKKKAAAKKKAPAKTKKVTAKKAAPKKAAKKKSVAKKKPAAKKKAAAKTTTKKKVVKRAAAKKVVAKARAEAKKAIADAPVVTITEKRIVRANKPVEIQRRVVFVGSCSNCDHLPVRVSKLMALFTLIIAVLSGVIISQSLPIDFTAHTVVYEYLSNALSSFQWL